MNAVVRFWHTDILSYKDKYLEKKTDECLCLNEIEDIYDCQISC